jgi:hypothetical protein
LDFLRHFKWVLACLLAAATIAPSARAASVGSAPDDQDGRRSPEPWPDSYFVIVGSPADWGALLQKIQRPDHEVRRVEVPKPGSSGLTAPESGVLGAAAVVQSVRIGGRVRGNAAELKVEMAILTAADDPTWVPIRLDGQRLIDAREGARILGLRTVGSRGWAVELVGRGRHLIEVDLRSPVSTRPARASLSFAIPEAPSTSLDLDFDRNEPDLIVGDNEVFGQAELADGKGWRLSAHLTPRSRVDVSWADGAEASGNAPLLTAQGDIAIDIDQEQMRTRSSWVIRCIRGITRTLEVGVADDEEVTDLRLDDQPAASGIEGGRGAVRPALTIPLTEPLRPGAERRLVMKTRRSYARGPGRRIAFRGFPITYAREQSGAIGVTQSANLWVAPASAQGLRRIVPTYLPKELAERPGTSLAFEFLDQGFELNLDVEASPPLVRSRSRTLFRIGGDRARSETTIELQWVRGRPFEVPLELGPGLEAVSVGPSSVVEAWNPTGGTAAAGTSGDPDGPRGLTIRLAPTVRDQSSVSLRLEGIQRLPRDGPVKLGLFAPDETAAVAASFSVAGDRGLSVELDPAAARSDRPDGGAFRFGEGPADRLLASSAGEAGRPALAVDVAGSPRVLPIRITRHERSVHQDTMLSAQLSPRMVEVQQRTTFTVRHGTLAALDVRIPPAVADGWELVDREVLDQEELPREPGGSRRYRLFLDRPVVDRATLGFRYRLAIRPHLDASDGRELAIPWITFPEAVAGPARIDLTTGAGVVFRGGDSSWTKAAPGGPADSGGGAAGLSFVEGTAGQGGPFRFRALALEPAALPSLLVPRLLIKSSVGFEGAVRHRAWYWVETHGPAFPFAMPEGARFIAARVGGRTADRVEFEPERAGYRLRLPVDAATRPVLVELEYQLAGSKWQAPRLLDGGVVLQTLWEARLPWDRILLGVPSGWSDENGWSWGGNQWVRRPVRDGAALSDWLLGDGAPAAAVEDLRESTLDDSQHLLFGEACAPGAQEGTPAELGVRILSRAWLVAGCSGPVLLVGFLAIFARISFRTAWAIAAAVILGAAAMMQPSVTAQLAQSAFLGAALTAMGLVIEHLFERRRSRAVTGREPSSGLGPIVTDSSLERGATVGSDDPTAIRVRTPSTMDYVPSSLASPGAGEEARSSSLERA